MAGKSKYTEAQKKAYYSGMGYNAGQKGKQIPFKNDKNKESFRAGYKAASQSVARYPDIKSSRNKK